MLSHGSVVDEDYYWYKALVPKLQWKLDRFVKCVYTIILCIFNAWTIVLRVHFYELIVKNAIVWYWGLHYRDF